jgi:hypothetical protein
VGSELRGSYPSNELSTGTERHPITFITLSFMRFSIISLQRFMADLFAGEKNILPTAYFPNFGNSKPRHSFALDLIKERVMNVIGWRSVPVDNSLLGYDPLNSEPTTE